MFYSVVVPVYNSHDSLREIAECTEQVFTQKIGHAYEILFVDDGSTDPRTWQTLEEIHQTNSNTTILQLTRNFGQQSATLCGLELARGDLVFTMDDDMQHHPEDLWRFITKQDFDVVIGQFPQNRAGLANRATSKVKSWFDRLLLGNPKGLRLSSYRMLSRPIVDAVVSMKTPYPFIAAQIFSVSHKITGVEVTHHPRKQGRSAYTFLKRWRLFSNLLINNSSLLLKVVGHLGVMLSTLSIIMILVVVYRQLTMGVPVQGWASLVSLNLFVGGMLLFSVGVLGEYLIRIIEVIEGKPAYVVRAQKAARSHGPEWEGQGS